jgi:hypothetical protein
MKCALVLCVVAMASNTLAEVRVEITNKAEGNAKVSTSHACECHTHNCLFAALRTECLHSFTQTSWCHLVKTIPLLTTVNQRLVLRTSSLRDDSPSQKHSCDCVIAQCCALQCV